MMFPVGGTVGALALCRCVDRYGIAVILLLALVGLPVCISLGMPMPALWLYGASFMSGVCVIGSQFALYAVAGMLYPTMLRSAGVGSAIGIGKLGSVIGSVLGGVLLAMHWPVADLFMNVSGVFIFIALLSVWLGWNRRRAASQSIRVTQRRLPQPGAAYTGKAVRESTRHSVHGIYPISKAEVRIMLSLFQRLQSPSQRFQRFQRRHGHTGLRTGLVSRADAFGATDRAAAPAGLRKAISLQQRIALTMALLAALMIAIGVLGLAGAWRANQATRDTYENKLTAAVHIGNAELLMARTRLVLGGAMAATDTARAGEQIRHAADFLKQSDEQWRSFVNEPHEAGEASLIDAAGSAATQCVSRCERSSTRCGQVTGRLRSGSAYRS